MILLRPTDPTRPIIVWNATPTTLEAPPGGWAEDAITYVIESTAVEVHTDG